VSPRPLDATLFLGRQLREIRVDLAAQLVGELRARLLDDGPSTRSGLALPLMVLIGA
jgi:hypothetical protein